MEVKIICKIHFSVLSYYPSIDTNENINVGILFHILSTDERVFHIMSDWNRLESFDDELDIKFMKRYLFGIIKECEPNLINKDETFSLQIAEISRLIGNKLTQFGFRFGSESVAGAATEN